MVPQVPWASRPWKRWAVKPVGGKTSITAAWKFLVLANRLVILRLRFVDVGTQF
jgi:hypothetical protein